MLDFLKKIFRYKKVDLEAKLRPTPECTYGGIGEVEFEAWSDGRAQAEISIKHSSVPDGSDLEVVSGGTKIAVLPVAGGYAKQHLHFDEGQQAPSIRAGDVAELRLNGVTLYRGSYRRD